MRQYLDVLKDILDNGVNKQNRTGISARSVLGRMMRFNMADGFPAVTTKKLAFKQVKAELLWFITGSDDVNDLRKLGAKIWDANADAEYWRSKARFPGDVGRIYGVQWRHWRTPEGREVDQLANVIHQLKIDPSDRRIIMTAWNPGELDQMALPACHVLEHFYVSDGKLSLLMYQRSCDMFLGVPFNIASSSLLLCMVAQVTGLEPGEFVHVLGDAHVYHNHIEQVREQLSRDPYSLPTLQLNPNIKDIDSFTMDDIKLIDYKYHPPIKADMAV